VLLSLSLQHDSALFLLLWKIHPVMPAGSQCPLPGRRKDALLFAAEVHLGVADPDLLSGREGSDKEVNLPCSMRWRVADSYWFTALTPIKSHRRFSIDRTGQQILRLAVQGRRRGVRVDLGGPASRCHSQATAAPERILSFRLTPTHVAESGSLPVAPR